MNPSNQIIGLSPFLLVASLEFMYVTPDIIGMGINIFCAAAQPLAAKMEILLWRT